MEGWPASLACVAMAAMVSQVSTKHSPLVVGFVGAAVALGWNSSKQFFFLTTKTEETSSSSSSSYDAEEFLNDMRSSQSDEVCMKFNSTEVPSSPLAIPEGNKVRTATEDGSKVDEDCANQVDPSCDTNLQEGVSLEPLIVESVQPLPSESDRTEVRLPGQKTKCKRKLDMKTS
jgi:hypothetical protein